jgi:hypothetical protein
MATISDVAASIKKNLAASDIRDLEFLARLFEDSSVTDANGESLTGRLTLILSASSDGQNNGVTHFAGIYAGCHDLGFRKAFKDPWPGFSDNQVGHFTTAVDMGFRPLQTYALVPWWARAAVFLGTSGEMQAYAPEDICIRLIIGHEQVADNAPNAKEEQAKSATEREVALFENALSLVTPALNQDPNSSLAALKGINIGSGQGNSIQDLHLSLFGYKLGRMIRYKDISDRVYAAKWIRRNIGGQSGALAEGNDGIQPMQDTFTG